MFFAHSKRNFSALGTMALLLVTLPVFVHASPKREDSKHARLASSDRREESLQRARARVLALLGEENACSAWFRGSVGDPAAVFQSLQFKVAADEHAYISRLADSNDLMNFYKHPWAARSWQLAGPNSTVLLNSDGAFFNSSSPVVELNHQGGFSRYLGFRMLTVGPFKGSTSEAQITTLLHELGHVTNRIPEDDDSWDGKSSRNTKEVLHHCKNEIREFAKREVGERE
jgi:hypothetical protein